MTTQRKDSNWVYVVSLSAEKPEKWGLTWIEVVTPSLALLPPLVLPRDWPRRNRWARPLAGA